MPLTDLLQSLDARAARELAEVTAIQHAQAADLREAAEREAVQLRERAVTRARAEAEEEAARRREDLTAELRRRLDETRYGELERLHAAVRARLEPAAGTAEGRAATEALLREALAQLPGARRVHVHPAHREAAELVVADHPGNLEIRTDLEQVGAVVADDHGRRLVNTVPERLAALWPAARAAVVAEWRWSA